MCVKFKFVAVVFATSFGLVGCAALPAEYANRVTARWKCKEKYGFDSYIFPAIKAWVVDATPNGFVKINGMLKEAQHQQNELGHRWDFDYSAQRGTYLASLAIAPDGAGKYYYYFEDEAKPSVLTECKKVR